MTSESQILWYRNIRDLEDRQRRVLRLIVEYPGVSSRDISRIARMDQGNVCRRIGELRKSG